MASAINVYNQSTVVTNGDCAIMVAAMNVLLPTYCKTWNIATPQCQFVEGAPPATTTGTNWIFVVLDTTDQAGALAYHSEDNDVVDGFIFAQTVLENGGVKFYKDAQTPTVASALAHEIFEALGDPYCNRWLDDGNGNLWCFEVCDPCEGNVVPVKVPDPQDTKQSITVGLSDFILPSWTDPQAQKGPYNYTESMMGPFTIDSGGYAVVRDAYGNVNQVFGKRVNLRRMHNLRSHAFARFSKRRR